MPWKHHGLQARGRAILHLEWLWGSWTKKYTGMCDIYIYIYIDIHVYRDIHMHITFPLQLYSPLTIQSNFKPRPEFRNHTFCPPPESSSCGLLESQISEIWIGQLLFRKPSHAFQIRSFCALMSPDTEIVMLVQWLLEGFLRKGLVMCFCLFLSFQRSLVHNQDPAYVEKQESSCSAKICWSEPDQVGGDIYIYIYI